MMKQTLIECCLEILKEKKDILEKNIELALEASRDDTKSSAGDKYETTRAMMQIEIDSNRKRLLEAQVLENILLTIDINAQHTKTIMGSVAITDQGIFFISIGLGKIKFKTDEFFAVSPESPIGKELINKQIGDSLEFNKKTYKILDIL